MLLPGVAARRTFLAITLETRTAKTLALALKTLAAFRTVLARTRKTWAFASTTIVAARRARLPRLLIAAILTITEILAWPA